MTDLLHRLDTGLLQRNVEDKDMEEDKIDSQVQQAVADALRDHKRAGNPVAVWDWDKNQVKIVPPEEIILPAEPAEDAGPA